MRMTEYGAAPSVNGRYQWTPKAGILEATRGAACEPAFSDRAAARRRVLQRSAVRVTAAGA
jgi:hypothetical protein